VHQPLHEPKLEQTLHEFNINMQYGSVELAMFFNIPSLKYNSILRRPNIFFLFKLKS